MVREIGTNRPTDKMESNSWEDYLDPGENLLWQGAPATGIRFSVVGAGLSVFGIFFLAFSLFWMVLAFSMEGALLFALFGVPFVLVGFWLVFGHWFFDAYKRKNAHYALTSKRAIIARTLFGRRRMESYPITSTNQIRLLSGKLDTVYFAQRTYQSKSGPSVTNYGFRYIKDGQNVFDLLRTIQENTQ